MRCVTSILLGVWQFSSFTLSEWGPGLCSIAGKGAAANFFHRVKGGKICAKTTLDIHSKYTPQWNLKKNKDRKTGAF
jgi:hypothetical protein